MRLSRLTLIATVLVVHAQAPVASALGAPRPPRTARWDRAADAESRAPCRRRERRDGGGATWDEYAQGPIDGTLAPFGIPPLSCARPRTGFREMRITADLGFWSGPAQPRTILRLYQSNTGARGEVYRVWWAFGLRPPYSRAARGRRLPVGCGAAARQGRFVSCRFRLVRPVDWGRVAARLDSLGAWSLPSQPLSGGMKGTDLGSVMLERLDSAGYASRYYYGPTSSDTGADGRAARIGDLLESVTGGGLAARPDSLVAVTRVPATGLRIAGSGARVIDTPAAFRSLWRRASRAGTGPVPLLDFTRVTAVVVSGGEDECGNAEFHAPPAAAYGDTLVLRVDWALPPGAACARPPAPVEILAVPRRGRLLRVVNDRDELVPALRPPTVPRRTSGKR